MIATTVTKTAQTFLQRRRGSDIDKFCTLLQVSAKSKHEFTLKMNKITYCIYVGICRFRVILPFTMVNHSIATAPPTSISTNRPGHQAFSTWFDDIYLTPCHMATGSLTLRPFVLAAVLYVDDTDNFHLTPQVNLFNMHRIQLMSGED